jgi:hypothetical protein
MHFVRYLLSLISSYWGKNVSFFRIFEMKWKALKIHHENRELFYDSVKFLQKKMNHSFQEYCFIFSNSFSYLVFKNSILQSKGKTSKMFSGFFIFFNLKMFLNLGVLKLRWLIPGRVFFWEVWANNFDSRPEIFIIKK